MQRFLEFITNVKTLIAIFLSLMAAAAWGFDYIHKPYLLKSDILKIFNSRDINRHEVNITKLEIQRGMASNNLKTNEFDLLINIEKLQILKLKGVQNNGSN